MLRKAVVLALYGNTRPDLVASTYIVGLNRKNIYRKFNAKTIGLG